MMVPPLPISRRAGVQPSDLQKLCGNKTSVHTSSATSLASDAEFAKKPRARTDSSCTSSSTSLGSDGAQISGSLALMQGQATTSLPTGKGASNSYDGNNSV